MKPQISSMAADKMISSFSEISDNNAAPIDFHAMAERVAAATKKAAHAPVVEQSGMLKQLWNGLVEDFKGVSAKPAAA